MPTLEISSAEQLESLRQGFVLDSMLNDALDRIELQNEELVVVLRRNRKLEADNTWLLGALIALGGCALVLAVALICIVRG